MDHGPIQSIDRMFDIMETLSIHPRGISLTELSAEVDLHKSTVHRFLTSLMCKGYVIKEDDSTKYRLTMRMFEIGSRVVDGMNILNVARPYLEQLADGTDESVHMVVRDKVEIVYVFKEESSNSVVRMSSRVGLRNPMYCTGVGKAIMAFLPEDEAKAIWDATQIVRHTEKTITSFSRMQTEMARIRENGYSVDDEEHERGVRCVAVPIRDISGKPVAAISISAPVTRMDDFRISQVAPMVKETASRISVLLGANPT